jgi:hypothetical protein
MARAFSNQVCSLWTKGTDFCRVTQFAQAAIAEENVDLVRQKSGVLSQECDFLDFDDKSQPLAA